MPHRVPYTIRIDTARRVVRVLVSGIFDAEEGPRMATDARKSAGESGLNILYDIRAASPGKLENSDIFWWPRTVPALRDPKAPRVRVAAVYVAPQRPIVDFWETAFRNVGLTARAFENEEDAIGWLTGAAKPA
jgi:hypothetical protein